MIEMVRAQRKALETLARLARNPAGIALLCTPPEENSGPIEMVRVPKELFDVILTGAIDRIAQQSGGKEGTQKELAEALMNAEEPIPDALVGSLMGYAGHWGKIAIAEELCHAFRGRDISLLEDKEMTEYFQTQMDLKHRVS